MIDIEKLLDLNQLYVVGVSGGCDSMALLDNMYKKGFKIVVCHVNYHLRDDSDLDQETVLQYCSKYQIPCYVREINKKSIEKIIFKVRQENFAMNFITKLLVNMGLRKLF